ncbi:unnamed protein product [Caenorhabditis angaria]|uniref:Uncharacterized protein n=1 Tax=Caenorhabditis angaria TaxID=860376 RepID=A0A9P1NBD3_9PELO|nr:unnamed protein product [Caenorhabditis angaria]
MSDEIDIFEDALDDYDQTIVAHQPVQENDHNDDHIGAESSIYLIEVNCMDAFALIFTIMWSLYSFDWISFRAAEFFTIVLGSAVFGAWFNQTMFIFFY